MASRVQEPPCKIRKKDVGSLKTTGKISSWVTSSFADFDDSFTSSAFDGKTNRASTAAQSQSGRGPHKRQNKTPANNDELWVDRHAPATKVDLAVHKKKVTEIETWLQHSLAAKKEVSLLLLTGPAGAGKTAAIRVLCQEQQCDILEWSNPSTAGQQYSSKPWDRNSLDAVFTPSDIKQESQESQFRDFLLRGNRYPSLQVDPKSAVYKKKIVLLEEFPGVFSKSPSVFHDIMRSYKARGRHPLVVIISDSPAADSIERLLLPKTLQKELNIYNISVNPVAPTTLTRILSRIATVECKQNSQRLQMPNKDTLDAISMSSGGDLRGAINSLQFSCFKESDLRLPSKSTKTDKNTKPRSLKKQGSEVKKGGSTKKTGKSESVAGIGGRDASLILFRALGKVLYCKREEPLDEDRTGLPTHLQQQYRDPLVEIPEEVVERSHISGDTFTAFLHQNYLEFYTELDDAVSSTKYMSDADVLTVDWASRSALQEYSTSVATRAIMFCNSCRAKAGAAGSGAWRPLHKPQWFSVFSQVRSSRARIFDLFQGYSCTPEELVTDYIPYVQKCNCSLHDPDQISLVQDLSWFTHRGSRGGGPEKLTEEDTGAGQSLQADEYSSAGELHHHHSTEEQTNLLVEDEDFQIDDFDDD